MLLTSVAVSQVYEGDSTVSDYTPMKRCSKCGVEKPATPEFFKRNKSCSDGLHTQCKNCTSKQSREYYYANRDEINRKTKERYESNPELRQSKLNYLKKWREEINRERYLEGKREWYYANREYDLQKSREWREKNPEYKKEYDRRYSKKNRKRIRSRQYKWEVKNRKRINRARREKYAQNPTPRRVKTLAREARKRTLPDDFTEKDYQRMMAYWDGCAITGQMDNLQIDHWIPLNSSECPGTVIDNMIPLAQSLNASKQDKDPESWVLEMFGENEGQEILKRIAKYFEYVRGISK